MGEEVIKRRRGIGRPMGAKDQFPRQSGHSTEENEAYLDFMRSR